MKTFVKVLSHVKPAGAHLLLTCRKTFSTPAHLTDSSVVGRPCWKSVLTGLIRNQQIDRACSLFAKIPSPDLHLYTMMTTALSQADRLDAAFHIFNRMPSRDVASWNSMMKGCVDCGDLDLALKLFDQMPERNVISWTTIMNGLSRCGRIVEAEKLFDRMPQRDTASWNSMISGYCSNGQVSNARMFFERMPRPNVISWTAMISGYDQNGMSDQALSFFQLMWVSGVKPTASTFACVLTACANALEFILGIQLHAHLHKTGYLLDSYVSTSLITMYANCKRMDNSSRIFHETGDVNVVSWTALITGYGLNVRHMDALHEFNMMLASGIRPNQSTLTSALNSCCGLEALDIGKKIQAVAVKQGLDHDVFVANSLIVMYSKCGDIDDGLKMFAMIECRNIVTWNSIIIGCAQNGYAPWALKLFDEMSASLVEPDDITFTGLLTACSHSRMLEKGKWFFKLLRQKTCIDVKLKHYACMVDVLGRSGKLEEAEEFIVNMPMEPNVAVWLTLLSACRVHLNPEVAQRTALKIFDLDPYNSAAYVMLSNIYASAGRWDDVSQVRLMMRCRGIVKMPGFSWITLKESRHEFTCGDRSHPMTEEIYRKLEWLSGKLKECGYIQDKRFALHDVDDEQKEASLAYHIEKLAIAFGLLNTVQASTIGVMKNLRVCGDRRSAVKFISEIVGRDIVLRDSSRFHHFRNGSCS